MALGLLLLGLNRRAATPPLVGRGPDHAAGRFGRPGSGERDDARAARLGRVSRPPRLGREGRQVAGASNGTDRPPRASGRPSSSGGNGWKRGGAIELAMSRPNDRIVQWIDRELARTAGGVPPRSVLMSVRLPRSEVRGLDRRPGRNRADASPGLAVQASRSRDRCRSTS